MSACYEGQQFVGIDLHRRRTVLVRMTPAGERLGAMVRFPSTPEALRREMAAAGDAPQVVLEATYGWYWAVETLQQLGARVHLAHPLGIKGFTTRRVKNDERDAADLADLLRMGRLPEAHIAPPAVRALRELVRHRAKLARWRAAVKTSIHAVLAKRGVVVPMSDLFGVEGTALLDTLCGTAGPVGGRAGGPRLEPEYTARVVSLRMLLATLEGEIAVFDRRIADALAGHPGYRTLQQLSGVGPVFAAVFIAEIGDVGRFATADKLTCWAGLTPRHRESDTTVHRGRVTKQGSKLVRWAAVEAVQRSGEPAVAAIRTRIAERRGRPGRPGQRTGRNIAKVAAARVLLKLVFYGLRDGRIRALGSTPGSTSDPGPRRPATATVA